MAHTFFPVSQFFHNFQSPKQDQSKIFSISFNERPSLILSLSQACFLSPRAAKNIKEGVYAMNVSINSDQDDFFRESIIQLFSGQPLIVSQSNFLFFDSIFFNFENDDFFIFFKSNPPQNETQFYLSNQSIKNVFICDHDLFAFQPLPSLQIPKVIVQLFWLYPAFESEITENVDEANIVHFISAEKVDLNQKVEFSNFNEREIRNGISFFNSFIHGDLKPLTRKILEFLYALQINHSLIDLIKKNAFKVKRLRKEFGAKRSATPVPRGSPSNMNSKGNIPSQGSEGQIKKHPPCRRPLKRNFTQNSVEFLRSVEVFDESNYDKSEVDLFSSSRRPTFISCPASDSSGENESRKRSPCFVRSSMKKVQEELSFYVSQNENLQKLLEEKDTEHNQLIDKLKNSEKAKKDAKDQVISLQKKLEEQDRLYQEQINNLESINQSLSLQINQLSKETDNLNQSDKINQSVQDQITHMKRLEKTLRSQNLKLKKKVSQFEKEFAQNLHGDNQYVESLKEKVYHLERSQFQMDEQNTQLTIKNLDFRNQIIHLQELISKLELDFQEIKKENLNLINQFQGFTIRIKCLFNQNQDSLSPLRETNQIESTFSFIQEHFEQLLSENMSLKEKISEVELHSTSLKEKIQKLSDENSSLNSTISLSNQNQLSRVSELVLQLSSLRNSNTELTQNVQQQKSKETELLNEIENQKSLNSKLQTQINDLSQCLDHGKSETSVQDRIKNFDSSLDDPKTFFTESEFEYDVGPHKSINDTKNQKIKIIKKYKHLLKKYISLKSGNIEKNKIQKQQEFQISFEALKHQLLYYQQVHKTFLIENGKLTKEMCTQKQVYQREVAFLKVDLQRADQQADVLRSEIEHQKKLCLFQIKQNQVLQDKIPQSQLQKSLFGKSPPSYDDLLKSQSDYLLQQFETEKRKIISENDHAICIFSIQLQEAEEEKQILIDENNNLREKNLLLENEFEKLNQKLCKNSI